VSHVFPPYYKAAKCRGVDFTNATGKTLNPLLTLNGTQSSTAFVRHIAHIIDQHPPADPLYLYVAFQNAHDPYENAPEALVRSYAKETDAIRRNFSAIVTDLDDGVGAILKLIEEAGLSQDTLVWFNSDNGGELPFADQSKCDATCQTTACCGGAGNNYPLRGGKFTLWEGGVRARSFVSGPLIPEALRGSTWPGLSHVSDVFATFAHLAKAPATMPTDGFNLWPAISSGGPSPRTELVHQPINRYWNISCTPADLSNPFLPSCGAAFTQWPYKLIVGYAGDNRTVPLPGESAEDLGASSAEVASTPRTACVGSPCLFDLSKDPAEAHNLAMEQPHEVSRLHARLLQLSAPQASPQPADALTPNPSDEECAKVVETGAWQPWQS